MIKDITYQADVEVEGWRNIKTYYGQTCRNFKSRYYEHRMAIKNENSPQATALSRYIWKAKKAGKKFTIKWSVYGRGSTYQSGSHKCMLCIKEKTAIALCPPEKLLNTRSELLHKCIHQSKFELKKNG